MRDDPAVPGEATSEIRRVLEAAGLGWHGMGPFGSYVWLNGCVVGYIGDYETRHDLEHAKDLARRAHAGDLKPLL